MALPPTDSGFVWSSQPAFTPRRSSPGCIPKRLNEGKERRMFARNTPSVLLLIGATAAGAVAVGSVGIASAATPTYVIHGDQAGSASVTTVDARSRSAQQVETEPIDERGEGSVEVVRHPVVAPAATVSRGLRQQPTYPDLVEVQVGVQTVLVDPYEPIKGNLPEGHWLVEAKQQADVPRPLPQVRIIRGSDAITEAGAKTQPMPEPAIIIPAPEGFDSEPAQPKKTAPDLMPQGQPDLRKMVRSTR